MSCRAGARAALRRAGSLRSPRWRRTPPNSLERARRVRAVAATERLALVRYLNGVDAAKCIVIGAARRRGGRGPRGRPDGTARARPFGGWRRRLVSVGRPCQLLPNGGGLTALGSGGRAPRGRAARWPLPGGRSPRTSTAPSWSAALTTEVRSAASLRASRSDLAHARDEEILKQGYLHRRDDGLLGTLTRVAGMAPKRRWHRLHGGALYYFDATSKDKKLLDLAGCSVVRGTTAGDGVFGGVCVRRHRRGRVALVPAGGERGRTLKMGLGAAAGHGRAAERLRLDRGLPGRESDLRGCVGRRGLGVDVRRRRALCGLRGGAPPIGRGLGRLRALSLDAWSPLVLDYLLQSAGNERAREVWEAVGPPTSWSRPVWKSKFYGAFVLNHRVVLHAIEATPARWRGDAGSSPLDRARTAASSPSKMT